MIKHKLNYLLPVAVMATGMFTPTAWATGEAFLDCLQSAESVCTLTEDVTMDSLYTLNRDLTIDLNEHNITSNATAKFFQVKGYTLNITGSGSITTTDATNTGIVRVYGTDSADSGSTNVTIDEHVTLDGPNPIVIYANKGAAYNTTVNVYGTLTGQNSGIWLIGTIANKTNYPTINIHDEAEVTASNPIVPAVQVGDQDAGGVGIAAMGYAEWNIDEATVTGVGSGIGIKGGIVNIDGASVTGIGDPSQIPPNLYNDGINPSGSAIQIEKNSGYPGGIELNIASGKFISEHKTAMIEYGSADSIESIEISGGTFSDEPSFERPFEDYLVNGYGAYPAKNMTLWNVLPVSEGAGEDDSGDKGGSGAIAEELGNVANDVLGKLRDVYNDLEGNDPLDLETMGGAKFWVFQDVAKYALEHGNNITAALDSHGPYSMDVFSDDDLAQIRRLVGESKTPLALIEYWVDLYEGGDGWLGEVTEIPYPITLTYDASEAPAVPEGKTRVWTVTRLHGNCEIGDMSGCQVDTIDATYDAETQLVSYVNDKFSTFIIAYEDVAEDEAAGSGTPETGTMTREGASAVNAAIITSVAIGLLVSITSFAYLIRRR